MKATHLLLVFFHLILFSYIVAWLWCPWNAFLVPIDCIMCVPVWHLLLISQHERHSHHNKQKTAISVHQEEWNPHPMSLFIPLSWPSLCTCALFVLLCNVHLMWLFVLYVLTDFLGLCFAVVTERTANKLQCLASQPRAVTHCDSVGIFFFYFAFF